MIGNVFDAVVYMPIYNALVYFVDLVPTHDIGVAVIIVTIAVRFILWPLSQRTIKAQADMKKIGPDVEELKKKYKGKPQEESKALLALYKERGIHPFSGILLLLVQLPILLGLYWVFALGGFPEVHPENLYAFVKIPEAINMEFLGLINMGGHSIVLSLLAAVTQFAYTRLSMGKRSPKSATETIEASFSKDMARSLDLQARYMIPLVIGVAGYFVAAAAPLYWIVGNLFMIGQEFLNGKRY